MRVGFVGKGGAGKTTVTALLARFAASKGIDVLAIDADINQHLAAALGVEQLSGADVADYGAEIRRYLAGTNPLIRDGQMLKTTPPGCGSRFVRIAPDDELLNRYARCRAPLTLLTTGAFQESDLGSHCYHSKTGTIEVILGHLLDRQEQLVLVDLTAGSDVFASGLCAMFDCTVMVVEPTVRSIGVFHQYQRYAQHFNIPLCALGNKVSSDADQQMLVAALSTSLVGFIPNSPFVEALDRGVFLPLTEIEPTLAAALQSLEEVVFRATPNLARRVELAWKFHEKNCVDWANSLYGADLRDQIDRSFGFNELQIVMDHGNHKH